MPESNCKVALSTVKSFKLLPNEIPLIVELASDAFGIADNPKVKVSVPVLADIVRPWLDEEAKVKFPFALSAINAVPLNDAVAKAFCAVTDVT